MSDNFMGFESTDEPVNNTSTKRMIGQVAILGGSLLTLIAIIVGFGWGFMHNRSVAMHDRTVHLSIQQDGTWYTDDEVSNTFTVQDKQGTAIRMPSNQVYVVPSTTNEGTLTITEPSGECVWFAPCPESESSYMVMTPTK